VGLNAAEAAVPALVRDINTFPTAVSSNPAYLGTLGGYSYLAATDGTHGIEVWKTDGTAAGTTLLKDIAEGAASSNPTHFAVVGSRAYFTAATLQPTQTSIWVTDGTSAGTHTLTSTALGINYPSPTIIGALGSKVLFVTSNTLWASDGTDSGTAKLADNVFGYNIYSTQYIALANGKAYFAVSAGNNGYQPWLTDGTPAGTHPVLNWPVGANSSAAFVQAGNYVYFQGSHNTSAGGFVDSLYRIRPSDDAAEEVATGITFRDSLSAGASLVSMGNLVLFIALTNGAEQVWRSDGTAAGTFPLVAFKGMAGNSRVSPNFTVVGNRGIFVNAVGYNSDLFATDGTVAGTIDLSETVGLAVTTAPVMNVSGAFAYIGSLYGVIYRTDGTVANTKSISLPAGTVGLNSIAASADATYFSLLGTPSQSQRAETWIVRYAASSDSSVIVAGSPTPSPLLNYDAPPAFFVWTANGLFFDGYDTAIGFEPWVSDGTAGGSHLVANIAVETQNGGSNPHSFLSYRNQLYFAANDGVNGVQLWRSNGTASGTQRAADAVLDTVTGIQTVLFGGGNRLFFFGDSPSPGLWQYDPDTGTAATVSSAIGKPYTCVTGQKPVTIANTSYFPAFSTGAGMAIWRTDGTSSGTSAVSGAPGQPIIDPCQLVAFGNNFYFTELVAPTAATYGLWRSDGTPAGTQRVASFPGGSPPASAYFLTSYAGALYFVAPDSSHVMILWRSDGTPAGTIAVAPLPTTVYAFLGVVNNRLLFWSYAFNVTNSLSVFDAATGAFSSIPNVPISETGVISEDGTHLFFSALGEYDKHRPWVTDGTAAGTRPVVDPQGNYPYEPHYLGVFHSSAIFTGDDENSAHWYWKSDGTVAGTAAVAQVPAGQSVGSTGLTVGDHFFFAVSDPTIGSELYAIGPDVTVASTTTQMSVTPTTVTTGGSATFTATVTAAAKSATPTGTITFLDGESKLGTANLGATGVATFSTASLAAGTHNVTAMYPGDSLNAPSTSAAITVVVNDPAPPVVVTPPPATGSNGGNGSAGGGGGGGVTGVWELLALALLVWRRTAAALRWRRGNSSHYGVLLMTSKIESTTNCGL